MVLRPAASAAPGNLLGTKILRPQTCSGTGPSRCANEPSSCSTAHWLAEASQPSSVSKTLSDPGVRGGERAGRVLLIPTSLNKQAQRLENSSLDPHPHVTQLVRDSVPPRPHFCFKPRIPSLEAQQVVNKRKMSRAGLPRKETEREVINLHGLLGQHLRRKGQQA